jgi:hypothetical protein
MGEFVTGRVRPRAASFASGVVDVSAAPSDASETSDESDAFGEEAEKEAHLAALAWRRREEQEARMAQAEGAVIDTSVRPGRPKRGEPRSRKERRSERKREPNMWAFFVQMKQIEAKGAMHARLIPRRELLVEYKALSGPMQYYWTHMSELWSLYERQQIALWPVLKSKQDGRWRRRKLMLQFYYLSLVEQKQLVDDWIVERTARQRERRAQELEESLARKTLAKIKKDMLAVVSNVDYVLREGRRPHPWRLARIRVWPTFAPTSAIAVAVAFAARASRSSTGRGTRLPSWCSWVKGQARKRTQAASRSSDARASCSRK